MPQSKLSQGRNAAVSGSYMPELECLRGVAISLVFLYHVAGFIDGSRGQLRGVWVSPWRAFIHGGQTGVSLFFVLSAFLLASPFLQEAAGGKPVDRVRYYERRALRILPLYWLVVVISATLLAHSLGDLLKAGPYLVFLNSFPRFNGLLSPLNGVWWSLATEVQFYVLLPLLPYVLRRASLRLVAGLLIAGAYVWLASDLPPTFDMSDELTLRHSLLGRAPLFACGIACAWGYLHYGGRFRSWAAGSRLANRFGDAVLIGLVLLLGLLLRRVVFRGYWAMELSAQGWHVAEGVLWTAILWIVLTVPLRLRRVVVNRFFEAVGRWSYSIYLLHVPLLYLFLEILPFQSPESFHGWRMLDFFIVAALASTTIGLSALSYRFVERPFLVRKARLQR